MKILWITNTIFPSPAREVGIKAPILGGWMYEPAIMLSKEKGVSLTIATIFSKTKELIKYTDDGIIYYLIPVRSSERYDKSQENIWRILCNEFKPDIVHIHGTEFPHGLACMNACPNLKYIISAQGLISIYLRYNYAGISKWQIIKNLTLYDIIFSQSIFHQKYRLNKRSKYEVQYIQRASIVSGRTSWDLAHMKTINPKLEYHINYRTLRNSFYSSKKWNINSIEKYSIFINRANKPIKGFHQLIKAMAIVVKIYPEAVIRVSGVNIIQKIGIRGRFNFTGYGYGKYIKKLLLKYNLLDNVIFMGPLEEKNMINTYLKSHIFVCPSSIENSPNSVAESQILGVPTIATFVGGTPDMITHNFDGLLYRFEEYEMLAFYIMMIFNDEEFTFKLSQNSIETATKRHDFVMNYNQLLKIYDSETSR
jgi:L-malate glycosyltransferase